MKTVTMPISEYESLLDAERKANLKMKELGQSYEKLLKSKALVVNEMFDNKSVSLGVFNAMGYRDDIYCLTLLEGDIKLTDYALSDFKVKIKDGEEKIKELYSQIEKAESVIKKICIAWGFSLSSTYAYCLFFM